jgi:hypothetical protein
MDDRTVYVDNLSADVSRSWPSYRINTVWSKLRVAISASLALVALVAVVGWFTSEQLQEMQAQAPVQLLGSQRLLRELALRRLGRKYDSLLSTTKLMQVDHASIARRNPKPVQSLAPSVGDGLGRGSGQRSHFGWGDTNADGVTVCEYNHKLLSTMLI